MTAVLRCGWAPLEDPAYLAYHDEEWGVPLHDDARLFEMLTLEGAQAGLSWSTILHKREGYRRAFAGFDPAKVARFDARKVERLMQDASIVRNRLKIESTVANARATLAVRKEFGSLDTYLWGSGRRHAAREPLARMGDIPADTPVSRAMSKDLKRRGFRFVGPTVCYAFMQATGMVNAHVADVLPVGGDQRDDMTAMPRDRFARRLRRATRHGDARETRRVRTAQRRPRNVLMNVRTPPARRVGFLAKPVTRRNRSGPDEGLHPRSQRSTSTSIPPAPLERRAVGHVIRVTDHELPALIPPSSMTPSTATPWVVMTELETAWLLSFS